MKTALMLLYFTLSALLLQGCKTAASDSSELRPDSHQVISPYQDTVQQILALPAWPEERQFTDEEWLAYARCALVLQPLCPDEVARIFGSLGEPRKLEPEAGKIMILLRVMFDVPRDHRPHRGASRHVAPLGGIPASFVRDPDANGGWYPLLHEPVVWSSRDGPRLSAFKARAGGGNSPSRYCPAAEYAYFRRHFELRAELRTWIDDAGATLTPTDRAPP